MNEELIKQALSFYGVKPVKIFPEQKGYRNKSFRIKTENREDLNLIFYKSEAGILNRIKRADELSEMAFLNNLPVRHLFDQRILILRNSNRTTYARLYYYLPGTTIAWEMFSMNHMKLLGWAMSDLHFITKDSGVKLPLATDELIEINERMRKYFSNNDIKTAMREKLGISLNPRKDFETTLEQTARLETQPLHLDLVRGNLLFKSTTKNNNSATWHISSSTLSGIIDFEKTAAGHPILDLARSYAFLLVDVANKPPEKIFKYLIESGYQKRGQNKIDLDPKLFESLTNFFLTYDFFKFLRHNPYESLSENHHFVRTRNLLIEKRVVKSTRNRR